MDFSVSEDQRSLRELTRGILEAESTHDRLREVESGEERFDRKLWQQLAKANLLGLTLPEAHGGLALGLDALCIVLEEVGRATAAVPMVPSIALGAEAVVAFGSDEQKQKLLPGIASGEIVLSAALVEDAASAVEARSDGSGFQLFGVRPLVPWAHVAQRVLVPARTDAGPTVFLIDPTVEGVTLETSEVVDQSLQSTLSLDGVAVSADAVLGGEGDGAAVIRFLLDRATLAICAVQLGVADRALEMTAEYTRERHQFDRPIGSFQAVHMRAGDAYVDLQCMKLTYWRALHRVSHGEDAEDALEVAKYWAAEGGARITYAAQHLHGGIGVDMDYPLYRYYLWATHGTVALGGPNAQLARIGERLAS